MIKGFLCASQPMVTRFRLSMAGLFGVLLLTSVDASAAYPERAVRVVVGFSPGGATDLIARVITDGLSERTGRSFFVENKAGAAGVIGAEHVANATPDGYTLIVASNSMFTTHQSLYKKLPYDSVKDFEPIARLVSGAHALVMKPEAPYKSVSELIEAAKSKPNAITYGSGGRGATTHLAALLFQAQTDSEMLHIPYRSTAPATVGLLSGEIDLMFDTLSSAIPQISSGKLRTLGVTSKERFPGLPDVPTIAEQGLPGYEMVFWSGLYAPQGTSADVIRFLEKEVSAVLQTESTRKRLAALGAVPDFASGARLAEQMRREIDQWAEMFARYSIEAE